MPWRTRLGPTQGSPHLAGSRCSRLSCRCPPRSDRGGLGPLIHLNLMETTLAVRQHTRAERELAEQLRFEAALSRGVLASVLGKVAVVDRAGTVIRVNDAWSPGDLVAGGSEVAVGASYLDVCRAAASSGPASQEMAQGIEAVLAGGHPSGFRMEYPSPLPSGERWHELAVQPLQFPEGGAVLTFADCTQRKRAPARRTWASPRRGWP